MRKVFALLLAALLVSSCTNQSTGAYTGSHVGYMLGSAIGGIVGGGRGHDIGALVGTVGGAAMGAAIGAGNERSRVEQRNGGQINNRNRQEWAGYDDTAAGLDDSGYDPQGRGDDRIVFQNDGPADTGNSLLIRNAEIFEDQPDGVLSRGETCQVVFEIVNCSSEPAIDVLPIVEETTGNKHVHISENLRVAAIDKHKTIRYTAMLKADNRLRDGQIVVKVGVAQGSSRIESQSRQFVVPTSKRTTKNDGR